MKKNILLAMLLVSVICLFTNAPLFAQNQETKDVKEQIDPKINVTQTKDNVSKDVTQTKDNVKKNVTQTKDNVKKDVTQTKDNVSKNVTQTKDNVTKEVTVKKQEMKKESRDKTIGKTKDGKVVFEGPKGGKYYFNDKGRKVYLKKGTKF